MRWWKEWSNLRHRKKFLCCPVVPTLAVSFVFSLLASPWIPIPQKRTTQTSLRNPNEISSQVVEVLLLSTLIYVRVLQGTLVGELTRSLNKL